MDKVSDYISVSKDEIASMYAEQKRLQAEVERLQAENEQLKTACQALVSFAVDPDYCSWSEKEFTKRLSDITDMADLALKGKK